MKKNIRNIILIILAVILVGGVMYVVFQKNTTPTVIQTPTSLDYKNTEYNFNFTLPISWQGYSIVTENWNGTVISTNKKIIGPEILIRHPLWTAKTPRQDIPIMIFTLAEWDLIQQEKLSLGAAPIGPTELGSNANYNFALPARYNYTPSPRALKKWTKSYNRNLFTRFNETKSVIIV